MHIEGLFIVFEYKNDIMFFFVQKVFFMSKIKRQLSALLNQHILDNTSGPKIISIIENCKETLQFTNEEFSVFLLNYIEANDYPKIEVLRKFIDVAAYLDIKQLLLSVRNIERLKSNRYYLDWQAAILVFKLSDHDNFILLENFPQFYQFDEFKLRFESNTTNKRLAAKIYLTHLLKVSLLTENNYNHISKDALTSDDLSEALSLYLSKTTLELSFSIIKILLKSGASLDEKHKSTILVRIILAYSYWHQCQEIMVSLKTHGQLTAKEYTQALTQYIKFRAPDLRVITFLIAAGGNPWSNETLNPFYRILFLVKSYNDILIIQKIISDCKNSNFISNDGFSEALDFYLMNEGFLTTPQPTIISALIDAGACAKNDTSLAQPTVLTYALSYFTDPNFADSDTKTPPFDEAFLKIIDQCITSNAYLPTDLSQGLASITGKNFDQQQQLISRFLFAHAKPVDQSHAVNLIKEAHAKQWSADIKVQLIAICQQAQFTLPTAQLLTDYYLNIKDSIVDYKVFEALQQADLYQTCETRIDGLYTRLYALEEVSKKTIEAKAKLPGVKYLMVAYINQLTPEDKNAALTAAFDKHSKLHRFFAISRGALPTSENRGAFALLKRMANQNGLVIEKPSKEKNQFNFELFLTKFGFNTPNPPSFHDPKLLNDYDPEEPGRSDYGL